MGPDGLTRRDRDLIRDVLARYPDVRRVTLFGSRAMGTFGRGSDIDLALEGRDLDARALTRIATELEDSDLPYKVDLLLRDEQLEPKLEAHIRRHGKPFGWEQTTLGSLGDASRNAIVGGPFGSNLVSNDYADQGVPVIRGQNMGFGRWVSGEFVFVSDAKADSLRANWARPGDVVFTQRGTLGQVAIVPGGPWARYVVSQSQMKATIDPQKADPHYVYYVFSNPSEKEYIAANAIQTGVPHTNLTQLRCHPIFLPPLDEQRVIASVLGALDDKIEQNRRTAQALEQLARAIFRAWFVDFEPVKAKAAGATAFPSMPQPVFDALPTIFTDSAIGPVPEGWSVVRLDDILTLQRGFDLPKQSRNDGSHPIFASSGMSGRHSEWKVRGPGVTTGRSGMLGQVFFVDRDFWPLNTSLWVKEYKRSNPWHAYFLLQTLDLAQFNAGSAVPTLNRNHVHSLPRVAAPDYLLAAFGQMCDSTFSLEQQLRIESDRIATIRDYLLPKLLSGQIRVRDAERSAGAVA